MVDFFGSRLLRWLTVPYRSRLFNLASKPFNQIADRVLGSRFLQDIAEFFILFQAMERGFVTRAREVEALLGDPRTTFVVVTTLEAAPAHEAGYLVRELDRAAVPGRRGDRQPRDAPGADVAGRGGECHAARRRGGRQRSGRGCRRRVVRIEARAGQGRRRRRRRTCSTQVAESFHDVALVATREAERRAELAALAPQVVDVEALPSDVHDLAGLLAIVASMRETAD